MDAAAIANGNPPPAKPVAEDERELVERARTDRAAFGVLYRRHVADVYAFAYRRCQSKEVAEEATSAAFERAMRAIGSFEWREAGIRPWLFRIVSNEVTEIYRRSSRATGPRGQRAARMLAATDHEDESAVERDVDRMVIQRALDTLSQRYRDVITLRYIAGLTPDEAAAELGWTKAVVAVTLHRALNALRAAVEAQQGPTWKGGAA